jgi:radical SAM superfamily enzyme YgiQ (UPF0313 family)
MRIQLIIPRDLTYRAGGGLFGKANSYAALTLTTLAALVPEELEAEISLLDEGVDDRDVDFMADLIAISVVSAGAPRAYEIAKEARDRGIHVALGGYHVTNCPEEASSHADTIFVGPAEETWPRFLRDREAGQAGARYESPRLPDLAGQPWPRRDLLKPNAYLPYATVFASRGCANQCAFCAVSLQLEGRRLQRPIGEVIAEIESLGTRKLIFLDPNFHGDRDYARQLMGALRPLGVQWGCLTEVQVGNDIPTLRLMRDSGCIGALVGFESLCSRTLLAMNKPANRVQDYLAAVSGFHDHGISVLGCFVFGFDNEGPDVFARTVEFVNKSGLDLPRYAILTPFPGTPLHATMVRQNRITCRDLEKYDCRHVVFEPRGMSAAQLQSGFRFAWMQSYRSRDIIKRVWRAKGNRVLTLLGNASMSRFARGQ